MGSRRRSPMDLYGFSEMLFFKGCGRYLHFMGLATYRLPPFPTPGLQPLACHCCREESLANPLPFAALPAPLPSSLLQTQMEVHTSRIYPHTSELDSSRSSNVVATTISG